MIKNLTLVFILLSFSSMAQEWSQTGFMDVLPQRFDDVVFVDEYTGWCINSNGQIYRTDDGGENWSLQYNDPAPPPFGAYLRAVDFIDEQVGIVGTLDGRLIRTNDGGQTWVDIQDSVPGTIPGVCGLSHAGQTFYGVGAYFYPAFFIKSVDAGETWSFTDMSAHVDGLVACHFVDEQLGFVGGIRESEGAVILKTTDGGVTWTEVFSTSGGSEYAWKIFQVNEDVYYSSLESYFRGGTDIMKSNDGGDSWELLSVIEDSNMDIQGIGFLDESTGWVGPRWEPLYMTTDGGLSWQETTGPTNINRFFLNINGQMYASGNQVYVYNEATSISEMDRSLDHLLRVSSNPISERLIIYLDLLAPTNVKLGIYTSEGRLLTNVVDGRLEPREHEFAIDTQHLTSGTHVLFLRTNEGFQSIKLVKE